MECISYCIANHIDLTGLDAHCKITFPDHVTTKSRDVLKLSLNAQLRIFIFKNGAVVSWGIKRHKINKYLAVIRLFSYKPITAQVHDEFSYSTGKQTTIQPHDYFEVDCLAIDSELDNDDMK